MARNNNYRRTDIASYVTAYKNERDPDHRYASFDYCFNHFSDSRRLGADIEKSCLALGFYLASWGMYRGKSFMLQTSAKHLVPAVEYIHSLDRSYWKIDVNSYNTKNIEVLMEVYEKLRSTLKCKNSAHLTLVTKIMLGVFGNVPAYDRYFCQTFKNVFIDDCAFKKFSKESLQCLHEFYLANEKVLTSLSERINTFDFISGKPTKRHYSLAKIIDMYGFNKGKS
jgi:hypothetical protein